MMCDDEDEELSSRQMFEKMCSKELQSRKEGTTCQNCGEPTGYGRGSEPLRYDTAVCSTECAKILYNY